ncbi:MAG: hypothetical protein MH472_03560 [Bacteroidia bacterium]|nr:hypothetical protein [Bacteroidia bacterium]
MGIYNTATAGSTSEVKNWRMEVIEQAPILTFSGVNCKILEVKLIVKYIYYGDDIIDSVTHPFPISVKKGYSKEQIKTFTIDLDSPTNLKIDLEEFMRKDDNSLINHFNKNFMFSTVNYNQFFNGMRTSIAELNQTLPDIAISGSSTGDSYAKAIYKNSCIYYNKNNLTPNDKIVLTRAPYDINVERKKKDGYFYHNNFITEWVHNFRDARIISSTINSWRYINIHTLLVDLLTVGKNIGLSLYICSNHEIVIKGGISYPLNTRNIIKPDANFPLNSLGQKFIVPPFIANSTPPTREDWTIRDTDSYQDVLDKKNKMVSYWTQFLLERSNNLKQYYFPNLVNVVPSYAPEISDSTTPGGSSFLALNPNGSFKYPSPILNRYSDIPTLRNLNLERGGFNTSAVFVWDIPVQGSIIESEIFFISDSSVFDPDLRNNRVSLDNIAYFLFNSPFVTKLEVQGHTAIDVGTIDNITLSKDRANNIKQLLINHSIYGASGSLTPTITQSRITSGRLESEGYASTKLKYQEEMIGSTGVIKLEENMRLNKRVSFQILQRTC